MKKKLTTILYFIANLFTLLTIFTLQGYSKENISTIINTTKEELKDLDLKKIIAQAKQAESQRKLDETAAHDNKIKDQNTLLWPTSQNNQTRYALGIYKRDFIEGAAFIGHLGTDYLLYSTIEQLRKDYLFQLLTTHAQEFINTIKEVEQKLKDFDNNPQRNVPRSQINRAKIEKELTSFIASQSSYISYNPLKQKGLLSSFALKLISEKAIDTLEDKLIEKSTLPKMYEAVYIKNSNKELEIKSGAAPLSFLTAIKYFFSPRLAMQSLLKNQSFNNNCFSLASLNKILDLRIPQIAFNPYIQKASTLCLNIAGLGLSTKSYDSILNLSWADYITNNKEQFRTLLENYSIRQDKYPLELELIELELKKFITNGHGQSLLKGKQWLQKRDRIINQIKLCKVLPIISIAGYKAYKWYKNALQ